MHVSSICKPSVDWFMWLWISKMGFNFANNDFASLYRLNEWWCLPRGRPSLIQVVRKFSWVLCNSFNSVSQYGFLWGQNFDLWIAVSDDFIIAPHKISAIFSMLCSLSFVIWYSVRDCINSEYNEISPLSHLYTDLSCGRKRFTFIRISTVTGEGSDVSMAVSSSTLHLTILSNSSLFIQTWSICVPYWLSYPVYVTNGPTHNGCATSDSMLCWDKNWSSFFTTRWLCHGTSGAT